MMGVMAVLGSRLCKMFACFQERHSFLPSFPCRCRDMPESYLSLDEDNVVAMRVGHFKKGWGNSKKRGKKEKKKEKISSFCSVIYE
jgi:hypothetical protein